MENPKNLCIVVVDLDPLVTDRYRQIRFIVLDVHRRYSSVQIIRNEEKWMARITSPVGSMYGIFTLHVVESYGKCR